MRTLWALLLLALVTLLLRSTALSALAARGVVLDVLAFAAVVWALREGETAGTVFGFALGLAADLDAAHWMGRHALVLCLLGYAVGRLNQTLVREQSRTHVALLAAGAAIHQGWAAAFEVGQWGGWGYVLQRLALAALATAPVGAVVLALMRRIGGQPLFPHATHATRA